MTDFSAIDYRHMARALQLAERGLYTTQPNPRVGCVIAQAQGVVGEGWHQRAGEPHAEVFALREAGSRARGATVYVTLEPCGKFGRTPPCADALIEAGVARVVIASADFDQADAGAVDRLRAAGIPVEAGLMETAARELNRGFFSRVERGRPWVRIKLAMSLDGRTGLSNGESKWITGEAAREDVQRWRARSSAIVTGIGTVLADNPRLTVRLSSGHAAGDASSGAQPGMPLDAGDNANDVLAESTSGAQYPVPARVRGDAFAPLRVVLDRQLRTPPGSHIVDGQVPTLIFHGAKSAPLRQMFAGVECIGVEARDNGLDLAQVLAALARRGMNEVQVEAGPRLCGAMLQGGFVDELLLYIAPVLLGDRARPLLALPDLQSMTQARRLRIIDQRQVGADFRILYRE